MGHSHIFWICLSSHLKKNSGDMLPVPEHLGKYVIKIGKINAKKHEIGKIKAIFGLGMIPIKGGKNGQMKLEAGLNLTTCRFR